MNKALLLAAVAAMGCGLPVTPNAEDCGQVLGIEVFVDGVTGANRVALTQDADGNTVEIPGGLPVLPMSCSTARAEVVQARDMGASKGWWAKDQSWTLYQLEFINCHNGIPGAPFGADGFTDDSTHQIRVCYGDDHTLVNPDTTFNAIEPHGSSIILVHELTHATYGEDNHCNWSLRYAPDYTWQWSDVSNFEDECANRHCSGDKC